MKVGDQVMIVQCTDKGETIEEYLGRTGRIVWMPPRPTESVLVQFDNGTEDAFGPEELEVIDG